MAENVKETPRMAGWWNQGARFLSEVRNEMARVSWPSRREVWATSIVVILTSMVFGLYLFAVDMGLSALVNWIFTKFGA